jgi:hypothetical protein
MDHDIVKFTAKDAAAAARQASERSTFAYSRFSNACRVRLKRFVTDHPNQKFMIYAVPLVLAGGALHDAREAINHVIHDLQRDGFHAQYLGENLIYISWSTPVSNQKVNDYVSLATIGQNKSETSANPVTGPGLPAPVQTNAAYKDFINHEIQRRQQEYTDEDASSRRLYTGSFTHEDAMRKLMHSHTKL